MKKIEFLRNKAIERLNERGWLKPSEEMIMAEMVAISEEPVKRITLEEYKKNKRYYDSSDENLEISL